MNTNQRSFLLCAALCGAWMWTGPAQAQLVGGAIGGGASGSLIGGRGLAVGGDLRMDASGSLSANPGELRTIAAQAGREGAGRARAAREVASAAGREAVDTAGSRATAVSETSAVIETGVSGRVDANRVSTDDGVDQADRKAQDAPKSDARKTSDRAEGSSTKGARSRRHEAAAGTGA